MVTQVYGSLNGIQVCDAALATHTMIPRLSLEPMQEARARSTVEVVQRRERVDSVGTA